MLIAHRGYSNLFKDNSKEALFTATQVGFDMIELDVNICKTGELVICHDLTIDGKAVSEYELYDLGEEGIITLHEYFHSINRNKLPTYIDVKGNGKVMRNLINYLECSKHIDLSKLYIATFNIVQLNMIIEKKLPVHIGLITANRLIPCELDKWLKHCEFFSFHWECYDNSLYAYLQGHGKQVFLYTCHDEDEYKYICDNYLCDGVISNVYIDKNI